MKRCDNLREFQGPVFIGNTQHTMETVCSAYACYRKDFPCPKTRRRYQAGATCYKVE